MTDPGENNAPAKGVAGAIERVKRRPVVVVVVAVVALISFVFTVTDQFTRISGWVSDWRNPNASEYDQLKSIDLDSTKEFFEQTFGPAKKSFDLCAETICPPGEPDSLRMFGYESANSTIRVLFEGYSLKFYAVTMRGPELAPELTWLDHKLGTLGTVTFAEALSNARVATPDHATIFMGPKSSAYSEVIAPGMAGSQRGFLLAWAPDGYGSGDMRFDTDSAMLLSESQQDGMVTDRTALRQFRGASTPNTYGEFRDDDSYSGDLIKSSDHLIMLLFAGTEL
jgi:hypothetical protein